MILWADELTDKAQQVAEKLKEIPVPTEGFSTDPVSLAWYLGGVLALLGLLWAIKSRFFGARPAPDLQKGMRENLAEYPPPPADPGRRRLTFHGLPVRIRLVVVAPTGKNQAPIDPDQVPRMLDEVYAGISAVVKNDKPRIKVWPPQLSVAGFAPTFHRLVTSPDKPGQPSEWIKVAGPARAGNRPILLGLALLADEANEHGQVIFESHQWPDALRVQAS